MITYAKSMWGLHLFYRLYGSAFLRCLPFALISAAETALLYVYYKAGDDEAWRHPYPFAMCAIVVGFVVVFRSNFGYERYWEGRSRVQSMTGRWADAYIELVIFHTGREGSVSERNVEFRETLMHLMSLMHGLALQHLRGDWDLHNLQPYKPTEAPPPVDAASLQYVFGPARRKDGTWRYNLLELFILNGTEEKRATISRATPFSVVGGLSATESQLLGIELGMFGESVMNTATYGDEVHASTAMSRLFGLSTGTYVPGAAERVQHVYAWVLQLLRQRYKEGEQLMPPPIVANAYRMLSEGLVAFEHARKLAETPFPFPWAQAVLFLLVAYALTLPLMVVAFIQKLWLAILIDIVAVQSFFALNEVARDLEDPFVYPPNDLPLQRLQFQFNERLKSGSSTVRPAYFSRGNVYMAEKEYTRPKYSKGYFPAEGVDLGKHDASLPDPEDPCRINSKSESMPPGYREAFAAEERRSAPTILDPGLEAKETGLRMQHPAISEVATSPRNPRQHPSSNLTSNLGGQIRTHSSPRAPPHGQGGPLVDAVTPPRSMFQNGNLSPVYTTWVDGPAEGLSDRFHTQ